MPGPNRTKTNSKSLHITRVADPLVITKTRDGGMHVSSGVDVLERRRAFERESAFVLERSDGRDHDR